MTVKTAADAVQAVLTKLIESSIQCTWLEGDHELLPSTPIACVFPGSTQRNYVGQPRRVEANIQIIIMVYHGAIQEKGANQRENLALVDEITVLLESDPSLGEENVIDTFVARQDFGESGRGRSKYYTTRIILSMRSRFNLGV